MSDFLRTLGFSALAVLLSFLVLVLVAKPPISDPTAPYIEVDEGARRLSYHVRGDPGRANCVIWQHGLLSSRYEVLALDEAVLAELDAFVVAADRPGYGESTLQPRRTFDSAAADAAALADAFNASRFFVAGVSAGGSYALATAVRHPARVRGALLLSAGGHAGLLSEEARAVDQLRLQDPWERRVRGAVGRHAWAWAAGLWFAETYAGGRFLYAAWLEGAARKIVAKLPEEDARCVLRQGGGSSYTLHVLPESARQGCATPVVQDLALLLRPWAFQLPAIPDSLVAATHIWHGTSDARVPVAYAHAFKEHLPAAQVKIVDGGGHFAYWVCGKGVQREALSGLIKAGLPA